MLATRKAPVSSNFLGVWPCWAAMAVRALIIISGGEPSCRGVCAAMLCDVLQVPPGDQPGLVYAVVEVSVLKLILSL